MNSNEIEMIKENMTIAVDLMEKGVSGIVECINEYDNQNKKINDLLENFKL